jgi:hypothetical protein
MKSLFVIAALASSLLSTLAFATTIRCTSQDEIRNLRDPRFFGPESNTRFEHVFELKEVQGSEVDAGQYSFELISGITVLVNAWKYKNSSDVQLNTVIANTTFGWMPYASSLGLNAVSTNLNHSSIPGTIDERSLPLPKFGESKKNYQERLTKVLEEQKGYILQKDFYKKFGQLASVFCRKD